MKFKVGDLVQVKYPPIACCGVIRQGHIGVVAEVLSSLAGDILILEDRSVHLFNEVQHVTNK